MVFLCPQHCECGWQARPGRISNIPCEPKLSRTNTLPNRKKLLTNNPQISGMPKLKITQATTLQSNGKTVMVCKSFCPPSICIDSSIFGISSDQKISLIFENNTNKIKGNIGFGSITTLKKFKVSYLLIMQRIKQFDFIRDRDLLAQVMTLLRNSIGFAFICGLA